MLELYHFNDSVCAQKVRVVLAEKGLEWVPHHVDLMKLENLEPSYLELNPQGVVPTLVHDGHVVTESTDIIEYLDDHFPEPPLRPSGAESLRRMRDWIALEDGTGLGAVGMHTLQRYIKPHMERLAPEKLDAYEANHPVAARGAIHAVIGRGGDIPQSALDKAAGDLGAAIEAMERDLALGNWLADNWNGTFDRLIILEEQRPGAVPARRPTGKNVCDRCLRQDLPDSVPRRRYPIR